MRQVTILAWSNMMEVQKTVREKDAERELKNIKAAHNIQIAHHGLYKVGKLKVKIEAHGDYPAAPIPK